MSTADQSSALIPFIEQGYIIEPLSPGKQIAVMVIAISYVGEKTEGVEVAKGQPYGRGSKVCICMYCTQKYLKNFY